MKKTNEVIKTSFAVTLIISFVLHIFIKQNILNIFSQFYSLGIFIFKIFFTSLRKEYLLFFILGLIFILFSILIDCISIIKKNKKLIYPLYWLLLYVSLISIEINKDKIKEIFLIPNGIGNDFSRWMYILFLFIDLILLFMVILLSTIDILSLKPHYFENTHLAKIKTIDDNINRKAKNVDEFVIDEIVDDKILEKGELDMAGETKSVAIIGPNGEKIYPGRTFMERVKDADPKLVQQYSDLKNLFLSYRKVHSRVSKTNDAFRFEGKLIGKLVVAGKGLKLYLALDPFSVDSAIYHQRDASGKKKFTQTPLLVRVKSPLSFRKGKELIVMACEKIGTVKKTRYTPIDWTNLEEKEEVK